MFDFKNGMLGVVIVALAIAGALFVSYLAGVDETQHEVTKYDYLADVNLLFDYDEEPQYIAYDPSTNYTGYYSDNSYSDIEHKYYFAENEVNFTHNGTANNYKINYKPTIGQVKNIDLSDVPNRESTSKSYRITYIPDTNSNHDCWRLSKPNIFASIIDNLQIQDGTNQLLISMADVNWSGNASNVKTDLNTVLIFPKSWITKEVNNWMWGAICNPNLDPSDYDYTGGTHRALQSFKVNLNERTVMAYSDAEFENLEGIYSLDNMLISWGDDPYDQLHTEFNLDDRLKFKELFVYRAYLNPADGVWLE